jgi:hypothetical protein
VVFDFEQAEVGGDQGEWQEAVDLEPQQRRVLARLLSGSPVLNPSSRRSATRGDEEGTPEPDRTALSVPPSLPPTRPELLDETVTGDLASWPSELCLFSGNNAVLCYPHPEASNLGLQILNPVSYRDYWGTIIRCIEYGCELRTVAKLMEHETSDALEEASDCLFKIEHGDGQDSKRELRRQVEHLRQDTSLASRLVARLRNVSMPTTIARSDYVMSKIEALNRVLGTDAITEHVEQNLNLIDRFLAHDQSVTLQRESTRLSHYLTLAAVFVSCIALPSSLEGMFRGGLRGFGRRLLDFQLEPFDFVPLGGLGLIVLVGAVVAWRIRRR